MGGLNGIDLALHPAVIWGVARKTFFGRDYAWVEDRVSDVVLRLVEDDARGRPTTSAIWQMLVDSARHETRREHIQISTLTTVFEDGEGDEFEIAVAPNQWDAYDDKEEAENQAALEEYGALSDKEKQARLQEVIGELTLFPNELIPFT